jgi:hypothetical protein
MTFNSFIKVSGTVATRVESVRSIDAGQELTMPRIMATRTAPAAKRPIAGALLDVAVFKSQNMNMNGRNRIHRTAWASDGSRLNECHERSGPLIATRSLDGATGMAGRGSLLSLLDCRSKAEGGGGFVTV